MPKTLEHIKIALQKSLRGESLSEGELQILGLWLKESPDHRRSWDDWHDENKVFADLLEAESIDLEQSWLLLEEQVSIRSRRPPFRLRMIRRVVVAAGIAMTIIGMIWIKRFLPKHPVLSADYSKNLPAIFLQSEGKTNLTLQDGSQIQLDTIQGSRISKPEISLRISPSRELVFLATPDLNGPHYSRLTNSRRKQTKVTLSDGSIIWLQASSSIRFQNNFTPTSREIELSGDALFDIKRDPLRPFQVIVTDRADTINMPKVTVLGTRFALSTDTEDHLIRTTLINGSLMVSKGYGKGILIHPGETGLLDTAMNKIRIEQADTTFFNSMSENYFDFTNMKIADVMKVISKWYGVKIETSASLYDLRFFGHLDKNLTLDQMLAIFSRGGNIVITKTVDKVTVH